MTLKIVISKTIFAKLPSPQKFIFFLQKTLFSWRKWSLRYYMTKMFHDSFLYKVFTLALKFRLSRRALMGIKNQCYLYHLIALFYREGPIPIAHLFKTWSLKSTESQQASDIFVYSFLSSLSTLNIRLDSWAMHTCDCIHCILYCMHGDTFLLIYFLHRGLK